MPPDPSLLRDRSSAAAQSPERWTPGDDLTVLGFLNVVLRHRRRILAIGIAAALLTGVVTIIKPRTYTSTASFIPQSSKQLSTISGLAAQLGVDVAGGSAGTSPAFYADLAKSKEVLGKLMDTTFVIRGGSTQASGTIADHLGIEQTDPGLRKSFAVRDLQSRMVSAYDIPTSVVTFSVSTENAQLSRAIADMLLVAVNRFNLENRQSQAGAERRFAEQRLAEIRAELRRAEDAQLVFLERNRVLGSPELSAERDRLQREVSLRTTIYTTMAQAYEQAKLEEVRDTPVITVLEHPEAAIFPDPRRLVGKTALAFVAGILLAIMTALLLDRFTRSRGAQADAMREFLELRREALRDVRSPLRLFRSSQREQGTIIS